jgi:hypothetical protein
MSIRPDHGHFAAYSTRAALDKEAERLATLLAVAERDLARLLSILEWLDGDTDLELEDGRENDDAEPSLGEWHRSGLLADCMGRRG